ncbi:MAG: hypothetical protein Kow00122_08390 [Thermoleophilia bacterium]
MWHVAEKKRHEQKQRGSRGRQERAEVGPREGAGPQAVFQQAPHQPGAGDKKPVRQAEAEEVDDPRSLRFCSMMAAKASSSA